jgi:hypothetical protein
MPARRTQANVRAGDAKAIAREWVLEEASTLPGFRGAYFAGSITWCADDAMLANSSDVDVVVVLESASQVRERAKLLRRGVLVEATYLAVERLQSPEQVLRDCHLASAFRAPSVIVDVTGRLTALQAAVSRDFAKRYWVERRCDALRRRILDTLDFLPQAPGQYEQVVSLLFPTSQPTAMLLLAGLRNPTVRTRYVAVRELLIAYGQFAVYEELLDLLGCARMDRARVEQHFACVVAVFDATTSVMTSRFPFGADLTANSRRVAIGGSQELIAAGLHREAVFWLAVTYARCKNVLSTDAPAMARLFEAGYRDLLLDLGIGSSADMQRRADKVRWMLPRVWQVAEAIMAANVEITNV